MFQEWTDNPKHKLYGIELVSTTYLKTDGGQPNGLPRFASKHEPFTLL